MQPHRKLSETDNERDTMLFTRKAKKDDTADPADAPIETRTIAMLEAEQGPFQALLSAEGNALSV